jgi:hypothetical protein
VTFRDLIQIKTAALPLPEFSTELFRPSPSLRLSSQQVQALERLQEVIEEPLLPEEVYLRDHTPRFQRRRTGSREWSLPKPTITRLAEGRMKAPPWGRPCHEVSESNPSIRLMRYQPREFTSVEPVARSASNSGSKRKIPQESSSAGFPANRLEPGSSRNARSASSRNWRGNEDAAAASSGAGEPPDQQLGRDKRPPKRRRPLVASFERQSGSSWFASAETAILAIAGWAAF